MIRRLAREIVLQSLFQIDFTQAEPEEALQVALAEQKSDEFSAEELESEEPRTPAEVDKAEAYAREVLQGVLANLPAIDERIGKYAVNWELKRMPGIDRNLLRIAVYEMLYAAEKQPVNIAVNEAVELAKAYGSDNSARFINGLLGKMMREEA
jgi:N utilization substance protein B